MIDEKIQAELRAKYNPDGSLLRRHQLRMLEMLKYFDELCQKHGIRYWLSSGNCIGVARHGGFIPWDDDIDVEMLREDYLKLEKAFKETDDYVLQTWKNDKYYFLPYAKLRDKHSLIVETQNEPEYKYSGIYIDVFILERSSARINKLVYYIYRVIRPLNKQGNRLREFIFLALKKIYFYSIPIFRFLTGWWPNNKLRHTYGCGWWIKRTRNLSEIQPLQRTVFDGVEVNVPNNLNSYLNKLYSNYMEIPPESKRRKPHVIKLDIW